MAVKEIYVSGGLFDSPFYDFYYDKLGTQLISSLSLDIFDTYNFYIINDTISHLFYIKAKSRDNRGLNLTGDGDIKSGIKSEETFQLTFDSDIDLSESISYFCTSHQSMNYEIDLTTFEQISTIENNSIKTNLVIKLSFIIHQRL